MTLDIIAEVMGDEDVAGSTGSVRHDDGSLSLDGEVTLAELRDDHGLCFVNEEVTTVAGLILAEHGTVPTVGDAVWLQSHELAVEDMEGHKITGVRVRPLER